MRKYRNLLESKYNKHFTNRKYYYSHKDKWRNNDKLGSLETQKIWETDINKSQDYIHKLAEQIRNYKYK